MNGRWVHFRIRDSYHPSPQSLLEELHGDDLLQGQVVELVQGELEGDGQRQAETFVVLRVEGLRDFVLLPVSRLKGVL